MSNQYEVTVDQGLGRWFIERFQAWLEAAGFSQLLRIGDPERRIVEYGRGDEILSIATHPTGGDLATIVISSETADLPSLISMAVREASADLVMCLMQPLIPLPEGDLEARVRKGSEELWARVLGYPQ
ncbi:MAG: hypothetical protein V3V35_04930 [Dehalococcoidia bacterium]